MSDHDRDDGEQTASPPGGGTVAWQAAIGGYRMSCSLVAPSADASALAVEEQGHTLEVRELASGQSPADVEAVARRLREEYTPRILEVAKRVWRSGELACLTTSWGTTPSRPADPPGVE